VTGLGPVSRLVALVGERAARLTTTQLTAAIAILSALALTGSLVLTGVAVRADQRQKAALSALQDYSAMVSKLGVDASFGESLTATDAAYLSAWLGAFQTRPGEGGSVQETCHSGRGGAGVRLIQAPGLPAVGLAELASARADAAPGLGPNVYLITLPPGALCLDRAVEVVVVRQSVGPLRITVGRVVERSGAAWTRAVAIILALGLSVLALGLAVATLARRRLIRAVAQVNDSLDHAANGDFSRRAPEIGIAPELTQLTAQVNRTLDRLDDLLGWLRDSSDQLAHDFRTPLARAAARLDQLADSPNAEVRDRLVAQAREDLSAISRAMTEAVALRDGAVWLFERVRLDRVAASVVELYEPLAEARGVVVTVDLVPLEVLGVQSLLQRAVSNLMDNAVKFAPSGSVIQLTVNQTETGARRLTITDAGPGMGQTPSGGIDSHGMGLPFVRAVMSRHGGLLILADTRPGTIVSCEFSR
jgi:signal transduction histidine kinase